MLLLRCFIKYNRLLLKVTLAERMEEPNAQPKWHESCEVSRHKFNYCNFGRMPIYGVDGKLGRNSESRLVHHINHHNKEEAETNLVGIDKNCCDVTVTIYKCSTNYCQTTH